MLHNWIKIFIYHLKQNKLFSFLNVLGLSIGIAGLIFAILYWNDEQQYDQWNPNKENVFLLVNKMDPTTFWTSSSAPVGAAVKEKNAEVLSYCYVSGDYGNDLLRFKNKKVQTDKILSAQANFFQFFPFEFIEGSSTLAMPDENSICISEKIASQLFGNQKALGQEVVYDNRKLLVRGVYKSNVKSAYNPSVVVNFIDFRLTKTIEQWGNFQYTLLIKTINPNSKTLIEKTLGQLYYDQMTVRYAKIKGISAKEFIKKHGEVKPFLEPLSAVRLHTKTGGLLEGKGDYQLLLIMLGLSVLILILSIVNYVNLATANAIKRAKEVGVRKIVGASKSNILLQFIFETVLVTLFSVLLSLVIVELVLPYYNEFLMKNIILNGNQFYLQLSVIFVITVFLAGILPAIYVSNFETLKVLKGDFGRSKSGVWLRNGMLVFQFAIAAFFIIGFYIVYQQVAYMSNKDFGFKANQIVNLNYRNVYGEGVTDVFRLERYSSIKNKLLNIKGVKKVAGGAFKFGDGAPIVISYNYKDISVDGNNIPIDFGMLEMMKIKMVQGRYLNSKFAKDTISNILINETAMKLLKEKNPIGKKIDWQGSEQTIVGVVKDFNLYNPADPIGPMTFFHLKTISWFSGTLNNIYVELNPATMSETLSDIEKLWLKDVDPDYPFVYDFVDKEYKRSYSNYVKQKNMFSVLNIIVILIALFGLFALASYSIERRMKEIAIRKTLGAETNVLLKELSKQYIIFCVIGFLIALFPVYYLLNKWLDNFAYRVDISIYPFLIGFGTLLFLTLFVVLSRAYFATKMDILKYLKYE